MQFVIVRLRCVECGHESTMVAQKGYEDAFSCFLCNKPMEPINRLREISAIC